MARDFSFDDDPAIHFPAARQLFRQRFKGKPKEARIAAWPLLSEQNVKDILGSDDKKPFDPMTMTRLVWFFHGDRKEFFYSTTALRLGQDRDARKPIVNEYAGNYIYFRFSAESNDHEKLKFVPGSIRIYEENKIPCFEHRSHSHTSADPEHTGYVFSTGDNIFLLGFRKKVMRLAVAIPHESEDCVTGLVLSVRTKTPGDPFAGRFIMFKESNTNLHSRLSDSTSIINPETGEPTTKGRLEFWRITKGGYAYFMLAHHAKTE